MTILRKQKYLKCSLSMNIPNSLGESSSKRQENGDASTESERPLKKARFAWQVKGKYHLRNDTNDSNKTSPVLTSEPDGAGPSTQSINNSNGLVGNTEQNLEILGDYLLKQDFNTLDSVITDPDKSLLAPSASATTETLQYPRYISSYDNNSNSAFKCNTNKNEHIVSIHPSMVSNNYNEDQCIARWQARQMAKGFVDNTINRVLDSWIHPPLPPDMDNSRFLALDVAEFINNLPGDNSIENEGILMAISAHGLQNTSSSSSSNSQNDESYNTNEKDDTFLSPPSSPMQSDEEVQDESNKQVSDAAVSAGELWPFMGDTKTNEDLIPFSLFPDSSNSYQYYNEAGHIQPNRQYDREYDGEDNATGDHYDFMDAAVAFAIQNKGLTTFGTDYG